MGRGTGTTLLLHMIQLTRLKNQLMVVNSDLVKYVEKAPDTLLTLLTGEKVVVRESVEEVLAKIVEFRRTILAGMTLRAEDASSAGARTVLEPGTPSGST